MLHTVAMYLPQAWPLWIVNAPGPCRALYAAPSTPITCSSRSSSHCYVSEQCCQIHLSPEIIYLIIKKFVLLSIDNIVVLVFHHLMKHFGFVLS